MGKTSFGGINLAEDGKTLWLVNLNQRALISVDVSGATATLPGTVNQYPISALAGIPACTNRVWLLALIITVPFQFTADRAVMHAHHTGNGMSAFTTVAQRPDLVSLLPSQLEIQKNNESSELWK